MRASYEFAALNYNLSFSCGKTAVYYLVWPPKSGLRLDRLLKRVPAFEFAQTFLVAVLKRSEVRSTTQLQIACSNLRIGCLFAQNLLEACVYIREMQSEKKVRPTISNDPTERAVYCLTLIPTISRRNATDLLSKFGSVRRVLLAPEAQLRTVPGLWRSKAQLICAIASQHFRPDTL